ncbi:NAD-binding protein [Rathayibacter sp. VKM Ac-2928]|nr:NAD(P)-binding domain-containing protein [Rathayibacter sp. VKM Ac-2928]MCJ1685353.1 NAD-binding protein [Rathayibacter sp. VKM Ac-2928]
MLRGTPQSQTATDILGRASVLLSVVPREACWGHDQTHRHPRVRPDGSTRRAAAAGARLRRDGVRRRREALQRAQANWLSTAPDGAALAARSDTLITVLPGPIECREALLGAGGALGGLAPGGVWLDFTSNDPRSVATLVAEAERRGIGAVAAPLRGGPADAAAGTLGFYLGGDAAAVHEVVDVLVALGHDAAMPVAQSDPVLAHVAKLVANTLWFGQVIAVTEVLLLGRALGWEPPALRAALLESPGASAFLERHAPALLAGDRMPDFPLGRVVEELETVLRLAEEAGTPRETIALVTRLHREALASFGDVDGELLAAALLEERAGRPLTADTPPDRDKPTATS